MHTSALKPLPAEWPQVEYTGTLLHTAQARTAMLDGEGHCIPVLCLEVELDNAFHTTLHVEQPFLKGDFKQCQAAAHHFKKGMRVTVHAPLVGMRLVARNATHIHIVHEHQELAA